MMAKNWLKYHLNMDALSEQTQKLLDKTVTSTKEFIEISKNLNPYKFHTRAAHAKAYASVTGNFSPNEDTLKVLGIEAYFETNQKVIIRFSNANNVIVPEKKNFPAYGMSLNFDHNICYPLVNFPLFPTDDVDAFLKLFIELNEARMAQAKGGWEVIKELPSLVGSGLNMLFHINPLRLGNIMWKGAQLKNEFLLNYAYHGIGCYRFGDYVAKIHTERQNLGSDDLDMEDGIQKDVLQSILKSEEISFKIMLQMAMDDEKTPVNILSKEWDLSDSPLIELGIITIPSQTVVENSMDIENMSFSPFQNPLKLQPVGRIQQSRQRVYEVSSETRTHLNSTIDF